MSNALGERALKQYREAGFHFPITAIGREEADKCVQRLEEFETRFGKLVGARRNKAHLFLTWLDDLIRSPRILAAVESVLGPDLLCWSTSFFIKEAGDPAFVSWHQDATYWGLSSPDVATVWVALTPATRETGCMKFIPGSHTSMAAHRETYDNQNLLSRGQEIAVEVDEDQAVYVTLEPGEASLHHVMLFHGSEPNRSHARRIGVAIRYLPTRISQLSNVRDSAMLVRGNDAFGHFDLEPRPTADGSPEALAVHDEIMQRRARILLPPSAAAIPQ